jgi:putative flavoprotein involved in K+ transport
MGLADEAHRRRRDRRRPVLDDGRYRAAPATGQPEREEVDAIVLATGYRPDLPCLTRR